MAKDKRRVHERARVNQAASLVDLHALHVEDKNTVEDLEGQSALASKDHDFLLGYLISQRHVTWNPLGLVTDRAWNLLP